MCVCVCGGEGEFQYMYVRKYIKKNCFKIKFVISYLNNKTYMWIAGARGGLVVKALRYKPAGRGFDSR